MSSKRARQDDTERDCAALRRNAAHDRATIKEQALKVEALQAVVNGLMVAAAERDALRAQVAALEAGTPPRRRLPDMRNGRTYKLRVGTGKQVCAACAAAQPGSAVSAHLTTGYYPDGRLAEIFLQLDRHRRGDVAATFAHQFAIAVSIGLQHGVPAAAYTGKMAHVRDESGGRPMVMTDGRIAPRPGLEWVGSVVDYIAWVLDTELNTPHGRQTCVAGVAPAGGQQ